jgi:eukaryotic-like serine/threonine-protein kinase
VLDRRAGRWVEVRTEACRATRVTAEQSEAVLDARMQCLDDQLHAMRSLIDAVSRGDGSVWSALEAAHLLPEAEACSASAVRARGQAVTFAEDPDARVRAAELDQLLARARTAIAMADLPGAAEALSAADQISAVLPDPVRRARVLFERGRGAEARSQLDQAVAAYTEAAQVAASAGADEVVADAAARMAYLIGVHQQRPADAAPWHSTVELHLARGVGGDHLRAFALETQAKVAFLAHEFTSARTLAEKSLELYRRAFADQDDPRGLSAMRLLAAARSALGDREGAARLYQRTLEGAERAYGPEHPDIAHTLTMQARADFDAGELAAARTAFERALAIRERAFGPDDPRVGESLGDLGIVATAQGDHAAAERNLRRWLAGEERADPAGLGVAPPLINLGTLLRETGRLDEARPLLERAIAIYEQARGPDFPGLVAPLLELADLEGGAAGCPAAEPLLTRALHIADRGQDGDPTPSYVLIPLAICEAEAGRADRALELARRAAALREAVSMPPTSLAEARFAEAHALWAGGRRRDARRPAPQARRSADPDLASHIDQWLEKPPRRRL